MGIAVFPAAASGPTLAEITTAIQNNAASVSSGNSAGWRRTVPAGLTLIASGDWAALTSVNQVNITGISGYSYLRLFISGAYGSTNMGLRINGNTQNRYNQSHQTANLVKDGTNWLIGFAQGSLGGTASIIEIDDADSANYKTAVISTNSPGSNVFTNSRAIWASASSVSSLLIFTTDGSNFQNGGYSGQAYALYGGY